MFDAFYGTKIRLESRNAHVDNLLSDDENPPLISAEEFDRRRLEWYPNHHFSLSDYLKNHFL